jgi:hypothetical protein
VQSALQLLLHVLELLELFKQSGTQTLPTWI